MADIELNDVFEKERLPKSNWQFISLVIYSPVGLVLAFIRFFIGINAGLAALLLTHTPAIRSVVLRVLCLVLGFAVEQDNKQHYDKSARVLVANCVTQFDHIALHLVTGCITPSRWETPSFLTSLVPGIVTFNEGRHSVTGLRLYVEKGETPLLLYPEGTTSGKNGILKFSNVAAQVDRSVQPVAVSVQRPSWVNIAPTVLGATFLSDLFWFLFTPYTVFRLKYLNVLHRETEESDEAFSDRMQTSISEALSLPATSFTASEKAEYEKRYLSDLNRPILVASRGVPLRNPELLRMTSQVSEVLPHVPQEAILKDLNRTWSVETTISNMLEGVVQFTPLGQTPTGQSHPAPSPAHQSPSESTPFSSQSKVLSFAERKAKMIEEARRRYIEKKGLKNLL